MQRFTGDGLRMTSEDRMCVPFPLYHCAGCVCAVLNCVTRGATIILPSASFDPLTVLEVVQAEKATVIGGVPTMFIAELQHPEFPRFELSTLRSALIGGAPCPVELLSALRPKCIAKRSA